LVKLLGIKDFQKAGKKIGTSANRRWRFNWQLNANCPSMCINCCIVSHNQAPLRSHNQALLCSHNHAPLCSQFSARISIMIASQGHCGALVWVLVWVLVWALVWV